MKKTAVACSNLALIKYWGKVDFEKRLPTNDSLSVNLDNLTTTTTVDFSASYKKDLLEIDGIRAAGRKFDRVRQHLDRIRSLAGRQLSARVVSRNNFPSATGLSSSASGFAALTKAAVAALELKLTEKEMSIVARQASGSACRSIPTGFSHWHKGRDSQSSYAESIFPIFHWQLTDLVVIISHQTKSVPTNIAQQSAFTSPFFRERLKHLPGKINKLKKAIRDKDFMSFGQISESEALELHAIMMTSEPSQIYLFPGTLKLMNLVKQWRKEGLPVFFSLNTGHNLHVLCQNKDRGKILALLKKAGTKNIIINGPGPGTRLTDKHLF
ncbi:diphosphomevalonate decarboxylase [Candidatus Gottesmanbacteria bacterium RIFCSPHIGHO2_12_FULL_43_26]|nr:MAG: diphosphomevalonate decarboxylase [Candidatus Gottesmanbacteria bacterium RIFCSPHIGHO2_12_FULL_43_26]